MLILVGILLDLFVGWVHYATGYEIDLAIFYLVPIALVTRCVGLMGGIFLSVACAATWFVADIAAGHEHSHPLIPYLERSREFWFFYGGFCCAGQDQKLDGVTERDDGDRPIDRYSQLQGL